MRGHKFQTKSSRLQGIATMIMSTAQFVEQAKIVQVLSNTTPSSTTPRRISMKGWERCTVVINALNATTVTGSAITLKQATDIANANSDEKAVTFTTAYRDLDVAAAEGLTAFAVTSNTFTTDSTNSKELQYIIEVTAEMLDIDNGFDCLRVGTGNATASTLSVEMILWGAKYGKPAASMMSARAN
jgi:hypothetical protein